MPPGMNTKKASGLAAAIFGELGGEIELTQRPVDLVGDLAFEVLLEAAIMSLPPGSGTSKKAFLNPLSCACLPSTSGD